MKKNILIGFIALSLAWHYLTADERDSKNKGFSSVEERNAAAELGLGTHAEYSAYLESKILFVEAKALGFSSIDEMKDARQRGFSDKESEASAAKAGFTVFSDYKEFLEMEALLDRAKGLGFASIEAMRDAESVGFLNFAEQEAALKSGYRTKAEMESAIKRQLNERSRILLEQLTYRKLGFIWIESFKSYNNGALFAEESCDAAIKVYNGTSTPSPNGIIPDIIALMNDRSEGVLVMLPKKECPSEAAGQLSLCEPKQIPARFTRDTSEVPISITANWKKWELDWSEFSFDNRIVKTFVPADEKLGIGEGEIMIELYVCFR